MQEIDVWIEKSEEQYRRGRYQESLVSAEAAISLNPEETNAWWFFALNHEALGNLDEAIEALDTVTDLSPGFANGWARYGAVLQALNAEKNDTYSLHMSAQEAYERAIEINDSHTSTLAALSGIYQENASEQPDEIDKEIYALTRLDSVQNWLTSRQLNRLGTLHYNNKSFFDAIKYWQRDTQQGSGPASLFNLGLVYAHTEVAQGADAIDIWRLVNQRYPEYVRAYTEIERRLPRLSALSQKARSTGKTVLDSDQWYQHYINPFELLDYKENLDPDDIDIKKIQKSRKSLLREIELEDGKVSWMGALEIDRSKAIGLCDELHNEEKLQFHSHVFNNKPLLEFLSRGEHQHFSVDGKWSPLETVNYLNDDGGSFKELLFKPFTKQFEMVFTQAIDDKNIAVLELLLDGRRWIPDPNSDVLFESARKKIDAKLDKLEEASKNAEKTKPTAHKIKRIMSTDSLIDMLNIFPTFFWDQQDRALSLIRDVAVTSYNEYGDSALSEEILELTKSFLFKSKKHNHLVQKDFKAINEIISEEKKHEAFLTSGGERWGILRDGVKKGNTFFPKESITSVRWGTLISGYESRPTYEFLFVFTDNVGRKIHFEWKASKDLEKHEKFSKDFINAIFHYIMHFIVDRQIEKLKAGQLLHIGDCSVSNRGIEFETQGWIFSKKHFLPWQRVDFDINNGSLIVFDITEPKTRIELPLRDVDNAMSLQFLKQELI